MAKNLRPGSELKAMPWLIACVVPLVLFSVAIMTLCKDKILYLILPKRSYKKFDMSSRVFTTKADTARQDSDFSSEKLEDAV